MTIPLVINHQNAINSKDEDKSENMPEEKSESETDKDLQSTEEVPANENTEKNQHEIDETTTKINQMMKLTHQTLQKINHKTT